MNEFLVGVQGENIVLMRSVPQRITKAQAINLAVWLVALSDDKAGEADSAFAKELTDALNS
jgi:hypothetical protein